MLFGIGCDIIKVSRFEKWIKNPDIIKRFYNQNELAPFSWSVQKQCEHYAVRFAAKEAFAKALGCGLIFPLRNVWVLNKDSGKPILCIADRAKQEMEQRCGQNVIVHLTLSHEKEYAIAYVAIERG